MIELIPLIVTVIEIVKRFIPDKYRTWANPLLALAIGLGMKFAENGVNGLLEGLGAAAGALATYKVPKVIGNAVMPDKSE